MAIVTPPRKHASTSCKNEYPTPKSASKPTKRSRPAKPLGFLSSKRYAGLTKTATQSRCSKDLDTYLCQRFLARRPLKRPFPHHAGHAVGKEYLMCKGSLNYRSVGRWYAQCCYDGIFQCQNILKYHSPPLTDPEFLQDAELACLLIMREELQSEPAKESTMKDMASRKTIAHFKQFSQLCDKLGVPEQDCIKPYVIIGRQNVHTVNTPSTPTTSPSRTNVPQPFPPISPLYFPDASSSVSELDSNDQGDFIPCVVIVFIWTKKYERFHEIALEADRENRLCLSEFESLLETRGICSGIALEAYSTVSKRWLPLEWSQPIGPVGKSGGALLLRYEGLMKHDLPGLAMLELLAMPLFGPVGTGKGKEQAG